MRKIGMIILLTCIVVSCQKLKKEPAESGTEAEIEEAVVDSAEIAPSRTPYPTELDYLVDYQGKYAGQEKLFEKDQLAERLKNLEGFNYEIFLKMWNTETPIVLEGDVLHMSGCKAHECPSNAYDFFIDMENDNVNVYHFRSNMLRIYQEKGWIELPEGFSREMEVKKSNAGIGSVEETESSYSLTVDEPK